MLIIMSYRLLILAGTLLLQINQLYNCHLKRSKKLKLLHKIIEILPLTPIQLANKIGKNGSAQFVQICKGTITAGEPTTSILNETKKVLYSKLYGADIILGPSPKKRLLKIKQPSYLKMMDNETIINIYESHQSIVVPTKQITLSDSKNLFEKLKSKFKLIFNPQSRSNFRNLSYSIFGNENIHQLYVPDPSECAILGKFKKQASQICCYSPILISPSKERMVALIQEDLAGDQVQRVVLVLVLTVTIGVLIKQLWNLYQKYKSKTGNILERLKKVFIKSRICSICKNNLSCMLSKSCMHMTTCHDCWQKQKDICSECNKKVKDLVQMYVC